MTILEKLFRNLRKRLGHLQSGGLSSGVIPQAVRREALAFLEGKQGLLLDIGCGEGMFLKHLANNKALKSIGLDLLFSQVIEAKEKNPGLGDLLVADASKLPFKQGIFDYVIALNFTINITSLPELLEIFTQIKGILKDGGLLVFDLREKKNFFNCFRFKFQRFYDKSVSTRCYTIDEFKDHFQKESLKIENIYSLSLKTTKLIIVKKDIHTV